jgi:hypothetical protein
VNLILAGLLIAGSGVGGWFAGVRGHFARTTEPGVHSELYQAMYRHPSRPR